MLRYLLKVFKPVIALLLLVFLSVSIWHYYPHSSLPPQFQAQEQVITEAKNQVASDLAVSRQATKKARELPAITEVLSTVNLSPELTQTLQDRDRTYTDALDSLQKLSDDQGKVIEAEDTLIQSEKVIIKQYQAKIVIYKIIAGLAVLVLVIVLV